MVATHWTWVNSCAGYPGCEFQIREALAGVVGEQKSEFFFDKVSRCRFMIIRTTQTNQNMQFLEYFFTDADAAFFKSLGLNCIRLPFNYRHFEGAPTGVCSHSITSCLTPNAR